MSRFVYDKLERRDLPTGRVYVTPSGKVYPSVTTILGSTLPDEKRGFLEAWAKRVGQDEADRISKEARDKGTAVHLMAERFLLGRPLREAGETFPPGAEESFNGIKLMLKKVDDVWGIEAPLYSDEFEFAGTADLIGQYKGVPSILDYKTSRRLKTAEDIGDYKLQLTAYAIAHNEMYGTDIDQVAVLMTTGDGFPQIFIFKAKDYRRALMDRLVTFYEAQLGRSV